MDLCQVESGTGCLSKAHLLTDAEECSPLEDLFDLDQYMIFEASEIDAVMNAEVTDFEVDNRQEGFIPWIVFAGHIYNFMMIAVLSSMNALFSK